MMSIVKESFVRCGEFGDGHLPQNTHFVCLSSEINSDKDDDNSLKKDHCG
jgi:hypothetical protein